MIIRSCAGGVVFHENRVFLLRNDKLEWVLPKGVIREKQNPRDVALARVKTEAGLTPRILFEAGDTSYEFYSQTRRSPVCNRIRWYVMQADTASYRIAFELGFTDGDYFPVEEAIERITYSQDKALVRLAYEKYAANQNS